MPSRTDITDRVITVIKANTNIASTRVYKGRRNVLPESSTGFPVVYVYMLREDVETLTMGVSARRQQRTMTLAVDYFAKQASPELLDETFDAACALIEAAVAADTTLNSTCDDVVLTSTEYISEGAEDQPFGRASLHYRITYFANEP